MKKFRTIAALVALAACGSQQQSQTKDDVESPPPANLAMVDLPAGSKVTLKLDSAIEVQGTDDYVNITAPNYSPSSEIHLLVSCNVDFRSALYSRPFPVSKTFEIGQVRPDNQITVTDLTRTDADKVKDASMNCATLVDSVVDAEGKISPGSVRNPTMSELSCILDLKIMIPAGHNNPGLNCPIADAQVISSTGKKAPQESPTSQQPPTSWSEWSCGSCMAWERVGGRPSMGAQHYYYDLYYRGLGVGKESPFYSIYECNASFMRDPRCR